jgi:hypothetical protein
MAVGLSKRQPLPWFLRLFGCASVSWRSEPLRRGPLKQLFRRYGVSKMQADASSAAATCSDHTQIHFHSSSPNLNIADIEASVAARIGEHGDHGTERLGNRAKRLEWRLWVRLRLRHAYFAPWTVGAVTKG